MDIRLQISSIIVSVLLIILIIWFVKRRVLNEQFAIIWFCLGGLIFSIALCFDLLSYLSSFFGILDPNNLILFCGVIFIVCFCLFISSKLSILTEKIKCLAQENAILRFEISEMKNGKENNQLDEMKKS